MNIVTPRLTLTPSLLTNVEHQVSWLNNPEIMKWSEQRRNKHTVESQLEYIKSFKWPNLFLEIRLRGNLIGTVTAYVDCNNNIADVGLLIGERTVWGNGYGAEAWSAMVGHLFRSGIRKVEAGCMAANMGMCRICRKTGMEEEGRRRDHFLLNDIPTDMVFFGKFA